MVLLPIFCPDCNGFTMKVVKYGLDDSYEARCTTCGRRSRGKISPELLIVKGASDNTALNNPWADLSSAMICATPGRRVSYREVGGVIRQPRIAAVSHRPFLRTKIEV